MTHRSHCDGSTERVFRGNTLGVPILVVVFQGSPLCDCRVNMSIQFLVIVPRLAQQQKLLPHVNAVFRTLTRLKNC